MKRLRMGSRGSQLALRQSRLIRDLLERSSGTQVEIEVIRTSGDKMPQASLTGLAGGTKGLFVKEIEEALLEGRIDLAVHSLKDVPTELPEGLLLAAFPPREDARDVLVATDCPSLRELPEGARLGTSSLRRRVQLQAQRPDVEIVEIRGNVDTRIRKVRDQNLDGAILAAAGLRRLGLDSLIACLFSVEEMVPAVGQGCLALEARESDRATLQQLERLDHEPTRRAAEAERQFLLRMGGGCQVPMGAHATIDGGRASFTAFISALSRPRIIRTTQDGSLGELPLLAERAAEHLLCRGGEEIVRELAP